MIINVGDIIKMKKNHPCGNNQFIVLRIGMDLKLKCIKCNHEFIISRFKAEKNIKQLIKNN